MRLRLVLIILVATLQVSSSPPPRVAIVRATAWTFEDEPVTMMIQVEPHAENRRLVVMALDGSDAVRSSAEQLDGATARRTRWVTWSHLPAGELMLLAAVIAADGKEAGRASRQITVLSRR